MPRPQPGYSNDFTFGGSFGFDGGFMSWGGSFDQSGWSMSGRGAGFGQASRGAVSFGRPETGCFSVPKPGSFNASFDTMQIPPYNTYRNTYRQRY